MDLRIHRLDTPSHRPVHLDPCGCDKDEPTIETTLEELEAFYTVRALLRPVVDCRRILMRDCINECKVLLDGDLAKPICKFNFHQSNRSIVIFSSDGAELIPITVISDLNDYSARLADTVAWYDATQPIRLRLAESEVLA